MTWAACVMVAILAAACGGSAPTCEAAIRGAAARSTGDKVSEADVAELVAACNQQKWPDAVRTCIGKASGGDQVATCILGQQAGQMSKGRKSEAELNLDAIRKSAKTYYVEKAEYPRESAPLTPAKPCCEFPDHKCPATMSDWAGVPAWDNLDFELVEDHRFQYSFEGKGDSYEARAVGDLDCDGTTVTYVLRGRAEAGNPTAELTKPGNAD